MDEDGYASGGVWNISLRFSPENMVISDYHWDYLQLVLCTVKDC